MGLQFVVAQVAAMFGREHVNGKVERETGTEWIDSSKWLGPIRGEI